ncbi:MAG: GTPase domain-containing protein [Pseudomonadota bacterium]
MTLSHTDAVARLIAAHRAAAADGPPDDADVLASLQLAASGLQKADWRESDPAHPVQVVVFGPTQSGKSTAVNLLLDAEAAGVSALAGHTVHAQAFHQGHTGTAQLDTFFEGYEATTPDALTAEALAVWSSQAVAGGDAPRTVWDTPDFDSLRSDTYLDAVARSLGLADVLLLVVSKDKYADHRVWEWLDLVAPLGKPLVVCVNKVDESSREVVVEALLARLASHPAGDPMPQVVLMPWFDAEQGPPELEVTALRRAVDDAVQQARARPARAGAQALIERCWSRWTDPLAAELGARAAFRAEVQDSADRVLAVYRSDFLEHPEHYETFQASLAEMLQLLEVPGLAGVLGQTRRLVTWPVRTVFGLAKRSRSSTRPESYELSLLQDRHSEALAGLIDFALVEATSGGDRADWWRAASQRLRADRADREAAFEAEIVRYRRDFEPEIQAAAQQLYAGLQDQPAVLNSLRAARFTADAAGVAFAVKTGGVGLADLAIAPAMLSVTTLLTESALGKYIDTVMNTLRDKQFDAVRTRLIDAEFVAGMDRALDALDGPGLYRVDEGDFQAIAAALGHAS